MANPAGTRANRWNQVVSAVAAELGLTSSTADAWLNAVWVGMYADEAQGNETAHASLRKWLEANSPTSPTLPVALRTFVI